MRSRLRATARTRFRPARFASARLASARLASSRLALGAAILTVSIGAAYGVWFMGVDVPWAVTTVLVIGSAGAALATLTVDEPARWDPPAGDTPRGTRLTVARIEASLAACDRLARPAIVRRIRALVTAEREDRMARLFVARRLRTLLVATMHDHGLVLADCSDDVIVAQLGPDALTILQLHDGTPVTTAAIARCLDVVERLATETPR